MSQEGREGVRSGEESCVTEATGNEKLKKAIGESNGKTPVAKAKKSDDCFPFEPYLRLLPDESVLGHLGVKYLTLCALLNGFKFEYTLPDQDFESVDVKVTAKSRGTIVPFRMSTMAFQVKCTSKLRTPGNDGRIAFSVDEGTYHYLRAEVQNPRLLLLVETVETPGERVFWDSDHLSTRLRGYWSNPLCWEPLTWKPAETKKTIYFPKSNVFDATALHKLMGYSVRRELLPEQLQ